MMTLKATNIEEELYRPYGAVICADGDQAEGKSANQGTATRYNHLAKFLNEREGAADTTVSVFRVNPWMDNEFKVELLEKHPHSTQIFIPMNAVSYLAIVALGGERPDLSTLNAFLVKPNQAITYHPGVWHHPMVALEGVTDFVAMSCEDGSPGDCTEYYLMPEERMQISIS